MATRNIASRHPLKNNFYTCMTSPWWASYLVESSKSRLTRKVPITELSTGESAGWYGELFTTRTNGIVTRTQMVEQEYDLPWPGGPFKNSVDTQMKILKIYDKSRHDKRVGEWIKDKLRNGPQQLKPATQEDLDALGEAMPSVSDNAAAPNTYEAATPEEWAGYEQSNKESNTAYSAGNYEQAIGRITERRAAEDGTAV